MAFKDYDDFIAGLANSGDTENFEKMENMKNFASNLFEKTGLTIPENITFYHMDKYDKDNSRQDVIGAVIKTPFSKENGEQEYIFNHVEVIANDDNSYGLKVWSNNSDNNAVWRSIGGDEYDNIPILKLKENISDVLYYSFKAYRDTIESGEFFNNDAVWSANDFIINAQTEIVNYNQYKFYNPARFGTDMYASEEKIEKLDYMKDKAIEIFDKAGIKLDSNISVNYFQEYDKDNNLHDVIQARSYEWITNENGKRNIVYSSVDISSNDDGTYGIKVYTGNSENEAVWNLIGKNEAENIQELELNEEFFKQIKADFNEYKNAIESGEQYNKSFSHPIDQYTKKQEIEKSFEDESIEIPATPNQKPDEPDMSNMSIEEIKKMAYVQSVCEVVKIIRAESAVLGSKLLKEMCVTQDDIRKYTKPEVQQEIIPQQKMEQTRTNSFKF